MKIAICDERQTEREKYKNIFQEIANKYHIEVRFVFYKNGKELLFQLKEKDFADIIFLDTNLSDFSGIAVSRKLRESEYRGEIVFLTASEETEHILSGYDVDARNYIIKDKTSIEKIEEIFLRSRKEAERNGRKYFAVAAANEIYNIPVESIHYFESCRRIFTVYFEKEQFEFHTNRFDAIQKQLEGFDFIRIHRCYLVALKEIKTLTEYSLLTKDEQILPVGQNYYATVKKALSELK